MKYVVFEPDGKTVAYTFPEVDPVRPNVPVSALYSADFLSKCVLVDDSTEVSVKYTYENGAFSAPVVTDPDDGAVIKDPATEPTLREQVATLTAKLNASIESNAILEDCLVEMANIVYA